MSKSFNAARLDVAAFSRLRGDLSGHDGLARFPRLAAELTGGETAVVVDWHATGEERRAVNGSLRPALHLRARAQVPLTCQRCMGEAMTELAVDGHFIFVDDEETAAALDDESDEDDVLAIAPDFDLHALIEDELLMALPLVPRHDVCPDGVKLSVQDAGFDAAGEAKVNPFASLAALKSGKNGD